MSVSEKALRLLSETKMAAALRDGQVSAGEQLFYLLVLMVGHMLLINTLSSQATSSSVFPADAVQQPHWLSAYYNVINIIGVIGVITTAWYINRLGDNVDFITRFVCLFTPISISAFLAVLAIGTVKVLGNPSQHQPAETVYNLVMLVALYGVAAWRYGHSLAIASAGAPG